MFRWKPRPALVHPPRLFTRLLDRIRGTEQKLVRASDELPLLLISYGRGTGDAADVLAAGYGHTLNALQPEVREPYRDVLQSLPTLVVVLLRAFNACGCLGHHHPRGTESRLTRRLASDLGEPVGEIDLASEGIRRWRPQPIFSMALGELGEREKALHFEAALLAVLLHELEHLALPGRNEREIRLRSNAFYAAAMNDLVSAEMRMDSGVAEPQR